MTNKLKSAFNKIHAEEQLKRATLERIREETAHKDGFMGKFKIKRAVTAVACFVPLAFIGFFSYNVYFTESAYVDMDINPSIELSINRFDRVIGANAYNKDGEDLLSGIDIKNEKIDTAIPKILELTANDGQLQEEGLVSVTVQTRSRNEKSLLDHVEAIVHSELRSYENMESDIFAVDSNVKNASHEEHLTPAKYLAILDLQGVDETATFEGCRHHSISNIKKQTRAHGGKHNSSSDNSQDGEKSRGHGNSSMDNGNRHGRHGGHND